MVTQKVINKHDIIEFLHKNKLFLKEHFGIRTIALFGSYARGEETSSSDIDLVIDAESVSFKNYCQLKEYLENNFQKSVDLCYLRGMRSFIRQAIEKDLIYA